MNTFLKRLKKSTKPTKPRVMFDLEKVNDPSVVNAVLATIGGRFTPFAILIDKDAKVGHIVTQFYKVVSDTATELLCKQRQTERPWITDEILDCCDQRRELKKKGIDLEGAKHNRVFYNQIRKDMKKAHETWMEGHCQE